MAKIVMSVTKEETRMALLENGKLVEYIVERNTGVNLVGSVFKGVVCRVRKGIQAAFIDIGLEQNAFLHVGDNPPSDGDTVLVQITKDVRGSKGPTANREITLPGKFVVLLLNANFIGISHKINGQEERTRLENICKKFCPKGLGIVVRTAAEGVSEENLCRDIEEVLQQYRILQAREKVSKAPALLHRELDLSVRIVRDYLSMDLEEIVVDEQSAFDRIKELLSTLPIRVPVLHLYKGTDIFAHYQLQNDIFAISDREVPLPSGGSLVIDYTEAMTVIDVNSGNFNGRENQEETILITNQQAAVEIARQLRLRDIGGIIVVDFIDMHKDAQKLEIMSVLQNALENDRMKPKVQDITVLNLVEITRKKSRQNLSNVLFTTCPICHGSGQMRSKETLILELRRKLLNIVRKSGCNKKILIVANPWLQEELNGREIEDWSRELGCELSVELNPIFHPETIQILDNFIDK